MKKVALLFVLAVMAPSLVLAFLAIRSLRDQQLVAERQQFMLCQGVADRIAGDVASYLSERQREFKMHVDAMLEGRSPREIIHGFDEQLRATWRLARVGFVVSLRDQAVLAPAITSPAAREFRIENGKFLSNRESVEVYSNTLKGGFNVSQYEGEKSVPAPSGDPPPPAYDQGEPQIASSLEVQKQSYGQKQQRRNVMPQQTLVPAPAQQAALPGDPAVSKLTSSETEFRQLVGDSREGMLARFLQNKLTLLFWYRPSADPQIVMGSQVDLTRLKEGLRELIHVEPSMDMDVALALLDDSGQPVAISPAGFGAHWKRPFVATEIGEALPHWEVAVYLRDPAKVSRAAQTLKLTLGLLITLLVLAIGIGGWLIVADLNRQITLARQKTDFVSNVSHELKTPLTSIRMFSELLAEGRVSDGAKQRSYLHIIAAEAARLTRLINNVLDFARLERGEKKYQLEPCDIVLVVRDTVEAYRPHLESSGFEVECSIPPSPLIAKGDADAIAQIIVNLLANAEKYSDGAKWIGLEIHQSGGEIEVRVKDRGPGVPRGSEAKIFEQFFRAHDSLATHVQGSGLGLTLARHIARAHGGDVTYSPRKHGGSCFTLRLPLLPAAVHENEDSDCRR